MDRVHISLVLFLCLGLVACSKPKSSGTVFPQAFTDTSQCPTQNRILNRFLVNYEDGRFEIREAADVDTFLREFVEPQLSSLRLVEFDAHVYTIPFRGEVQTTAGSDDWGQQITDTTLAWNAGIYGQNIKVAVVDSAVDYSHPQLQSRLDINSSEMNGVAGVDDDGNGFIDDIYGWDFFGNSPEMIPSLSNQHGTHVAGIIAADHTKGPVKGVAPRAAIIPINFMDQAGGGTLGHAIEAIKYAASRGASVINASWGGGACSQTLSDVIRSLSKDNILFVAASGNEYIDFDRSGPSWYTFPAVFNLPNQITVAATDIYDSLTDFSNKSFSLVHIAAPGKNIWSTVPGGGQSFMTGTSMAAPFVSGAAALLWSSKPNATYSEIKQALLSSAEQNSVAPYKVSTRGRLNVQKALDKLP